MNLIQLFTNENQIVINILAFIISGIQGILFYILFSSVFNVSHSKKQILLFVSLICLSGGIAHLFSDVIFSDILNLSVFWLSLHYIFKQSIKHSFMSLTFCYIGVIISGTISQLIFINILHIEVETLILTPLYYLMSCILSFLLFTIFIVATKSIKKKKIQKSKKSISLKKIIIINLTLGLITIFIESYLISIYFDLIPFYLTLLSIIALFMYFSISIYSVIRTSTLEKTQEKLENEILYNKTLTILHDNIRSFKHDFNNIVQAIGGYIALDDMDGLNIYYKKLLEDCKLTNNLDLLNPQTINNPSIYSLLTNKYYTASQKNIKMTFSIFTDLSKINSDIYELSRILGILLDNAIEAADETENKIIEIELSSDNKKQLFIIRNSCKDSNISTTKIFEKGYSTKTNNSGIGLWKVHKILSKNTNLDLYTTVKDNIFSQQLEVFY